MSTLRPLRDRVIVRPLADVQEGMIELLQGSRWRRGLVLAVGPGKLDKHGVPRPWGARAGDVVQFSDVLEYPEFDTGAERVLVLQEADICGVEEADWPGFDNASADLTSRAADCIPPRFERVL